MKNTQILVFLVSNTPYLIEHRQPLALFQKRLIKRLASTQRTNLDDLPGHKNALGGYGEPSERRNDGTRSGLPRRS
jgi:hypothetical protein